MYLRHRHRRGTYQLARESRVPRALKAALVYGLFLLILYWLGSWLLGALGFGNVTDRPPSTIYAEKGIVSVSLQGEGQQAAENGMTVFMGDTLSTGPAAAAALKLFDASWLRLDEHTDVQITHATLGKKQSELTLDLKKGRVWVSVPDAATFSGAILRQIITPAATFTLPAGTEAVLSPVELLVYAGDGNGVTVSAKGHDEFSVGEGQKWVLPQSGTVPENALSIRGALATRDLELPFLIQSRQRLGLALPGNDSGTVTETLTVSFPPADHTLTSPTMMVKGSVNTAVKKVTINGHDAPVDATARTFAQEVSPPAGEKTFNLEIKALDAGGNTVGAVNRTVAVTQTAENITPPVITSPVAVNGSYTTEAEELVLRGTAPDGTQGIMVNEYRLQLFSPDRSTWSYLASQRLGNLKPDENIYNVYALDSMGKKSAPATLTVWIGPPGTGMQSSQSPVTPPPSSLPNNAPTAPGTLSITGPTAGTSHTETGTGFLLEGRTAGSTATMWVNDYRLQLYLAGKTTWNYIASAEFLNLKPGKNVYVIVARNSEGKILDRMEYAVEYRPE